MRRSSSAAAPDRASPADLPRTIVELLRLAGRELQVFDHHREVCRLLLEACGCDRVELWETQGPRLLRSQLARRGGHGERWRREVDPPEGGTGSPTPPRFARLLLRGGEPPGVGRLRAALRGSGYRLIADAPSGLCRLTCQPGRSLPHASLALIAFPVEEDLDRGLLVLGWLRKPDRWPGEEVGEALAASLGVALSGRRAQSRLHERVKELTCLYSVSRLLGEGEAPLDQLLVCVAELLPRAWQFPELASGCVVLDGRSFHSPGRHEGRHHLRADILVKRERRGFLEVRYREQATFLPEERSLLQAVARQLGIFLERRQADDERTKLQEQLLRADRLATIGTLSAGVAHELNEPLGAILGFAQLAQKCPSLPASAGEDLTKVVAASLQARSIIKKLMLFARQTPTRKGPVDLNQLVQDSLLFLAGRIARENTRLEQELSPGLPPVFADGSQLQQVLVNLVVNAIQAMPKGGRLGIHTGLEGDQAVLLVEDTGTGMSAEVQRRAFLPFFTTKDVGKGTGLGLAVVHGIVKAHGGTIEVDSQPGRGTRFKVLLPTRKMSESEHGKG